MDSKKLIIIGGGICALSIAFEALKSGRETHVFYVSRKGASTPAAGGMLAPAAEAGTTDSNLIKWAMQSANIYRDWINDISSISKKEIAYNSSGSLLLALNRDHMSELIHLQAFHRKMGLQASQLNIAETREMEPYINPKIAGSLWIQDDNSVNPIQLQKALTQAILNLGGTIMAVDTIKLDIKNGQCHGILTTKCNETSRHTCKKVVVADGVWSSEQPELSFLPLRAVKGQYIRLTGDTILTRTIRTPDVYLIPRTDGEIYIGASMDEEALNPRLRAGATLDLLYHAFIAVRAIYEMDILKFGMGFRPALRDNNPGVGKTPIEGLYLNIGHYRHGILLAPIASKALLQNISNQDKDIPFSPLRLWT